MRHEAEAKDSRSQEENLGKALRQELSVSCRAEEGGAVDQWSSRSGENPSRRVARDESHPGGEMHSPP